MSYIPSFSSSSIFFKFKINCGTSKYGNGRTKDSHTVQVSPKRHPVDLKWGTTHRQKLKVCEE